MNGVREKKAGRYLGNEVGIGAGFESEHANFVEALIPLDKT